MPTDQISDADRNAAIDQSLKTMLGMYPKDSYSPLLGRDPRYINMYAPPVTQNGDPYLNGYGWAAASPPIDNTIPRATIGATGVSAPDDSHGRLLSPFYPRMNVPFDARAALVQALQSGPRPVSGPGGIGRIGAGKLR